MSTEKKRFKRTRKGAKKIKNTVSTHIYVLPNMLTTANMLFGFISILKSMQGDFTMAAWAIVAAAVFDLLDGRVARMTHSTSKFGAEYDSLCDLISFGMAPALLIYLWALQPFGRIGWLMAFFYVACGALRLARFNVQASVSHNVNFSGLPIPMAAGHIAGAVMAFNDLGWNAHGSKILLGITFLLGFVMVSSFSYRSFKDVDFRKAMPFRYLVLGVLVIFVIAYRPEVMIFLLFLTYSVLGAIFGVLKIGKQPKKNPMMYRRDDDDEGSENEDEEEDDHEDEDDGDSSEELYLNKKETSTSTNH